MSLHELPMILFTVLAQLAVGVFTVVAVLRIVAAARGRETGERVEELTNPALYAAWIALCAGLLASMFHMNDVFHVLNVFRHVGSSWLSREIVLGMVFAGLGLCCVAAQWFRWGGAGLRRALTALAALAGLVLVHAMSMIYYSLVTVPAWHNWRTPVAFHTTALLLGTLVVATALALTARFRPQSDPAAEPEPEPEPPRRPLTALLNGLALTAIVLLGVEFVTVPLHVSALSSEGGVAAESASVYSGAWFVARLVLVFLGAGLLAALLHRFTGPARIRPTRLAALASTAFALVLVGEFIGRSQFYESMIRIGM
ncbi:dimethyl sulfoxide reductase anchor subunit family protein [Streptomyces sp. NPDC004111]|uniref:dimethyl sulfoxide reductase anchor subunit family protein n=1 Tax=Streptomyces sp. NPDC004111 TaxID=3364690 RepID=UPI0036CEBAF0